MMSRVEYSWQVALQQSLLPLPRPFNISKKQSSTKARRASKTAAGLDVQKIALGKPREEFFS